MLLHSCTFSLVAVAVGVGRRQHFRLSTRLAERFFSTVLFFPELGIPIYVGAGYNSAFRLQWPYQTHPH